MSDNRRSIDDPPASSPSRRWETWGLIFLALALLLNMLFDDSPGEYVAIIFAVAALVSAVMHLVHLRTHRKK